MERFLHLFSDILLFSVVMTFMFTFVMGIILTLLHQLRNASSISILSVFRLEDETPQADVSMD
ncbi:MAG: hypothetical protein AAF824_08515 [Bacteroidota bacterium]